MSAPRPPSRLRLIAGLLGVGLATHALLSVDWSAVDPYGRLKSSMAAQKTAGQRAAEHAAAAPAPDLTPKLDQIACFGCHSYERFTSETRFNHGKHAGAGHCHGCHAFENHFEVVVRQEHCDACHVADGRAPALPAEGPQPF